MSDATAALDLARVLISRPSVTPQDAGAMDVLQAALEPLGFRCRRMRFGEVENLYARWGSKGPNLCYAGHTDVVPPGDEAAWTHPPFEAVVSDGVLHGRGSADMKSGIAAFVAAAAAATRRGDVTGSVSLLITGDEEGVAVDGTKRVVRTLEAEGERIDHCIVGEPSSVHAVGDVIKVGRRGSLNAWITVEGRQGHVAYPERAANPIPVLVRLLGRLQSRTLDTGWPSFPPSNLELTTVDVGNAAMNVIPASAEGRLNIRFNPAHTGESLIGWLQEEVREAEAASGLTIRLRTLHSGDAFLTEPGPFVDLVLDTVEQTLGRRPEPSTSGGTSDARFIRALCPVVELGLVGTTIHQVDERVPVSEIEELQRVYERLIARYFERFAQ
ncbi:MAG TPA: succinyl-diaminopimelate desuccinylase [Caulobacteraceae bacterium]|jgi:succinyl-diaminopimelate desuccinylase